MVSVFEVDLFLQASIFAILAAGTLLERKHKVKIHAQLMLNKKIMTAILILWLSSLIMGFFLYGMLKTGFLGNFPIPASAG